MCLFINKKHRSKRRRRRPSYRQISKSWLIIILSFTSSLRVLLSVLHFFPETESNRIKSNQIDYYYISMNECINHQSAAQTNQAIKELNNDALKVFERGIRSIHEDLVLTATTTTTTRRTRRTTTTGSEQEVVPVPVLSSLGNRRHGDPPRRGMCVNRALELLLVALQMALQSSKWLVKARF